MSNEASQLTPSHDPDQIPVFTLAELNALIEEWVVAGMEPHWRYGDVRVSEPCVVENQLWKKTPYKCIDSANFGEPLHEWTRCLWIVRLRTNLGVPMNVGSAKRVYGVAYRKLDALLRTLAKDIDGSGISFDVKRNTLDAQIEHMKDSLNPTSRLKSIDFKLQINFRLTEESVHLRRSANADGLTFKGRVAKALGHNRVSW